MQKDKTLFSILVFLHLFILLPDEHFSDFAEHIITHLNADELCSGVANGRVLNLELYTHKRQLLCNCLQI